MTATQILLQNPKALPLSIDAKINSDLVIRELLAPLGDVNGKDQFNVSGKATLDELNRNAEIRRLLDHQTNGAADPLLTIALVGGSNDIPGSDAQTAVASTTGLGGLEQLVVAIPDQLTAGANDYELLAAMPFTALIVDYQILVDTASAGAETWELRDALAGGGNALSDALSAGAVGRLRDASAALVGVAPTIGKGDPLILRRAVLDDATGHVIVTFQRLS